MNWNSLEEVQELQALEEKADVQVNMYSDSFSMVGSPRKKFSH